MGRDAYVRGADLPSRSGLFPTLALTGIPSGTSITDYAGPNPITIDGTTVVGKRIVTTVDVEADNVTFRRCSIDSETVHAVIVQAGKSNLTLDECDIVAGGFIVPISGFTVRRCRTDPSLGQRVDALTVAYSSVGHNGGNVLIEDCYFGPHYAYGPEEPGGDADHGGGFQMWGFGTVTNVTVRRNTIDGTNISGEVGSFPNGNAIFLADATYVNVKVEHNLFTRTNDVGGYFHTTLASNDPTSGHVIRGNRFGQQGEVVACSLYRMTPGIWSDNRWLPSLDLISQPAIGGM